MKSFPLREQLRAVPHLAWYFATITLVLGVFLFWSRPIDLSDPKVWDDVRHYEMRGEALTSPSLSLRGPWEIESGVARPQSPEAEARIVSRPGPWQSARVRLTGDIESGWRVRFQRDFISQTILGVRPGEEEVLSGDDFPGDPFDGEPVVVTIAPLRLDPEKPPRLTNIHLAFSTAAGHAESRFPGLLMGAFLPLGIFLFFRFTSRMQEKRALIISTAAGTGMAMFSLYRPEFLQTVWGLGVAVFTGGATGAALHAWLMHRRGEEERARRLLLTAEFAALVALTGLAAQLRWEEFVQARLRLMRPDALGFLEIARHRALYDTWQSHAPWVREPLFPWLVKAWQIIAPATAASARFCTLLVSLLTPVMIYLAGRRIFSPLAGIAAAALIAVNPHWAAWAVMGLRLDLVTVVLLGLVCIPLYLGEAKTWRASAFGVLGAALALLRINNLFLMIPFAGIEAWRRRWKPYEIILAAALVILPVIPHLVFNYQFPRAPGDPFLTSSIHTRYYLNADMIGEPGFPPTREAYLANPYAGEPVSAFEMFGYYGAGEVVRRFVLGYINLFAWRFPHGILLRGNELLMLFGLIGIVPFLRRRREIWWVPVWYVLFAFPVAFLAAKPFDYRLAAPIAPLLAWFWGAGVTETARWAGIAARKILGKLPIKIREFWSAAA